MSTRADQLRMFGEDPEPAWRRQQPAQATRTGSAERRYWPAAWDADRPATIRRLLAKEKWTVAETAFYFTVSDRKIVKSIRLADPASVHAAIDCGEIVAVDIATVPGSRPLYRIYRDSVLAFERARRVGAHEGKKPGGLNHEA